MSNRQLCTHYNTELALFASKRGPPNAVDLAINFSFKKSDQSKLSIFHFKKFPREFHQSWVAPLARFATGFQSPPVCICVYAVLISQCIQSKNVLPLTLLFPLCCFVFFLLCIYKISDAILWLVSFLLCVACFQLGRAKLFVHLFACWFIFYVWMCICLLGLFFVVFSCCA